MRRINQASFQGDVVFVRVAALPPTAVEVPRAGPIVVAHSETGHNHQIEDGITRQFRVPGDSLTCYLQMGDYGEAGGADVVHRRAWLTHETQRLMGGPGTVWMARCQREMTPAGWRRVAD